MVQRPDYTLLDHLTEICEVVDFDFRYLYVNDAAAEWERISSSELIGHTVLEVHPGIQSTRLFLHLKECLGKRKPVAFGDRSFSPDNATTTWKIKMDPVAEGAFIHSAGLSVYKTKVRIRKDSMQARIAKGSFQQPIVSWPAYDNTGRDPLDLEVDGWLEALDARTRESKEHIFRVAEATVALARLAGVPENAIVHIRNGALLHDIGNIGVPDAVLMKSDKLTAEEWKAIRKHPLYAQDLFYPIEYLRSCLPIPFSHHEKWDGTGYPLGLKGEKIPLAARLFAIVDVCDRLSSDRVYGTAWPHERIMDYIQQQSGCHFDPQVVDLFLQEQREFARFT